MIDWKIWYADRSTFTSEDGKPEDAPGLDVQIIVSACERVGRRLLNRHDYYWFNVEHGEWRGGEIFDLWNYLHRPGIKIPKFGSLMLLEEFNAIYQLAKDDPDFPRKSAMLPGGRKE